jgi:LPXTG-site transpeptidase (sortase) family protein
MPARQNLMRLVERLLWVLATTTLGLFLVVTVEGRVYQLYLNWKFDAAIHTKQATDKVQLNKRVVENKAATETQVGSTDVAKPVQQLSNDFRSTPPPQNSLPFLGRLRVPRLNMSIMLLEGVDDATLRRGIGHIPGTALPGERGNTAIAGHRDTFFRALREIRKNDQITIQTLESEYHYVVESVIVVSPEYVNVLGDSGRPVLTLVTCYPFQFVGPAPKRFIVQASLQE